MVLGVFYPQVVILPPEEPDRTRLIPTDDLIAKWRLGDLTDDWFNQFTLTNTGSVVFKRGRFGDCAKFDGTNRLTRAHSVVLNPKLKDFTIVIDFRRQRGTAGANMRLIHKFESVGDTGWRFQLNSDMTLRLRVGDGTAVNIDTTDTFDDGKWHRAICIIDRTAATATIWVDDYKTANVSGSIAAITGSIASTEDLALGADPLGGIDFIGELDNASLYFRKFTGAEIKTMMLATDKLEVDASERGGDATCSQLGASQFSMNFDGSDSDLKDRYEPGSLLCMLHDIVDMDKIRAIWNLHTEDDEAMNKNSLILQLDPLLSAYLFTDGNANDSKATNNGTWTGDEAYEDGPGPNLLKIRGRAAKLAGAEFITLANEANFDFERTDKFSVSMWVKFDDLGVTAILISKRNASDEGWNLRRDSSNQLRLVLEGANGNLIQTRTDAVITSTTKWYHLVFTYDGTSLAAGVKIYVDGVSVSLTPITDTLDDSIVNNLAVRLGAEATGTLNEITGQLARVRIFNKLINTDQINALFKEDRYQFIEGGGLAGDGNMSCVVTDNESLDPTGDFSIEGEVQLPAADDLDDHTVIQKGVTNPPYAIFVVDGPTNILRFRLRTVTPTNYDIDYVFTPDTKFKFLLTFNKTNNRMRLYIDGIQQGSDTTTAGELVQNLDDLGIGAVTDGTNILQTPSRTIRLKMWERELTAAEATDLNGLTHPNFNCLFDGIIMEQPIQRKANLPFHITAKDFLFDRLVNDDITQQFSDTIDLGAILRRIVSRSSLVSDFNTVNVEDVNITADGKYFIRTKLSDAFKWVMDNANGTFYSIRRGFIRYLFGHIVKQRASGVTITTSDIIKQGTGSNPLFYNFNNAIFPQSNIIQVEGGFEFTIEEQVTFDNDTTKSGEATYYGLKATPEFIKYGRLEIKVKKVGDPTFDLLVQIREDKAGDPAGPEVVPLASVQIPREEITDEIKLSGLDFDVILDTAKTYWLVFFLGGDASNHYEFADNGGVSDTNMETSSDDSVWTPVGYTFVYNWQHKLRVISQTKDGDVVKKYRIRKITVADPTITKSETARTLARGLLARLGKVHIMLQNMMVKNISALPCAGQTVQFTDALTGIDEPLEVQTIKIPLSPGRGGEIRKPTITIGDRVTDPQELLTQFLADFRNQVEADQPVTTETQVFAEGLKLGFVVTGRFVPPFSGSQDIGLIVTHEAESFAGEGDALWDLDDVQP